MQGCVLRERFKMDCRLTSHDGIFLRSIKEDDLPNLLRIFILSRPELMEAVADWEPQRQTAFLGQQFQIQLDHYKNQYPQGCFDAVLDGEIVIGRLLTAKIEKCLHLVDISLLPNYRNKGIGSSLIIDLLRVAGPAGMEVRLHVLKGNAAARLYRRLGFLTMAEAGLYQTMYWCAKSESEEIGPSSS